MQGRSCHVITAKTDHFLVTHFSAETLHQALRMLLWPCLALRTTLSPLFGCGDDSVTSVWLWGYFCCLCLALRMVVLPLSGCMLSVITRKAPCDSARAGRHYPGGIFQPAQRRRQCNACSLPPEDAHWHGPHHCFSGPASSSPSLPSLVCALHVSRLESVKNEPALSVVLQQDTLFQYFFGQCAMFSASCALYAST